MLGVQNRIQPSQTGGVGPHRHQVFLVMLCHKSFPRMNPASEEQYWFDPAPLKYTGIVISTAEEFYSFAVFISELEKVTAWFSSSMCVLSCYNILASLRNSFCGSDVEEGLWLGNCTAFIFTEDCRTVGMSWFSGPTAAWKDKPSPIASLTIQITVSLGPVYVLRKPAEYCASWLLSAIFNLVCTSWTMWVCG